MPLLSFIKKAYWGFAIGGLSYLILLLVFSSQWLQRHALYAHKIHTGWWHDLNKPEQFGFANGELLYAWHVLPLGVYAKHEAALIDQPSAPVGDVEKTLNFELLSQDPESRLVIFFHGNAGHVAQAWRTDSYRSLVSGSTDRIHVLTADYRGFGYSTGSPTEQGLIIDGISLVNWALNVAKIPPERIVIAGQSLGTAVATGVAEYFAIHFPQIKLSGLVLVAGFSDIPALLLTYNYGGIVPVLSPLRPYPKLQTWFVERITDTWHTASRLSNLLRVSRKARVILVHAKNDMDIRWTHSDSLFTAGAMAIQEGLSAEEVDEVHPKVDLGEAGWTRICGDKEKSIRQVLLRYGGHNRILTHSAASLAILRAFGEVE